MWVVANYIQTFPSGGRANLEEMRAACRDALARLPHDHCARYLAHVQAECCARLKDTQGFLDTWNRYRAYFDCREKPNEWFENKRKYLLTDIPMMARYLEQNRPDLYRKVIRGWRGRRITELLQVRFERRDIKFAWWWLFVIGWLVLQLLLHFINTEPGR